MTEEELREEATSTVEWESVPMIDRPLFVFAYVKGASPRENRIEELEKENAELKEKLGKYQIGMFDEIEKRDRRLTKATELLKWALHSDPEHDDLGEFEAKWKEAEQFLKEVEV